MVLRSVVEVGHVTFSISFRTDITQIMFYDTCFCIKETFVYFKISINSVCEVEILDGENLFQDQRRVV